MSSIPIAQASPLTENRSSSQFTNLVELFCLFSAIFLISRRMKQPIFIILAACILSLTIGCLGLSPLSFYLNINSFYISVFVLLSIAVGAVIVLFQVRRAYSKAHRS
jgi:hypothetical protein